MIVNLYYLIQIDTDGAAVRLGPYAAADEQKQEARKRMAEGKTILWLDVNPSTGEPNVGRVLMKEGDLASLQHLYVEVLCGNSIDGGHCVLPRHGDKTKCTRWVGP